MKADELFAASDGFFPPESSTSGPFLSRYLLPFSLWHSWILRVMESPYIVGGDAGGDDFIIAVLACSLTRSEFVAILSDSERLADNLATLSIVLNGSEPEELQRDLDGFAAYVETSYKLPEYWEEDEGNAKRGRVPFEWRIVQRLLEMRICQTEVEAWNYSLPRAAIWSAVQLDSPLGPEYIDQKDREMIKQAEALTNGRT